MQLSGKQKHFLNFFLHFLNTDWILNISKQKVSFTPGVFPILRTPKNEVKQISKKSTFRAPFEKQHVKGDQTLSKFERHHLYHIYWSLWRLLSWKKSLVVTCKVLRMFIHILTTNEKCSLLNRDNLTHPIRMQLSQKQKKKSQFVSTFLKSIFNFEYFEKKDNPQSWCIPEITDSVKRG